MKKRPLVSGFRHAGLIVKDLDISLKFYSEILGLDLIQRFTDSSDYINTITGLTNGTAEFAKLRMLDGAVIELLTYPSHPTKSHDLSIINVGIAHIALRVDSALHTYEALVGHGINVLSPPVLSSEGIAKVFFCLDPDGYRVEIVEMIDMLN